MVLVEEGVDFIVVDIVYGYIQGVFDMIVWLKVELVVQGVDVVVGNIVIYEVVKVLCVVGVDGIKVGIGLGLICIICVVVGVGVL